MVESQILTSDVTDRRILSAMGELPRERFVPPAYAALAYMDEAVPSDDRVPLLMTRDFLFANAAPLEGAVLAFAEGGDYAAIRKAEIPLDLAGARRYLDVVLAPLCRVGASVELVRRGLDLQGRLSLSFYDSLIVAAALEAGCSRLWSEDLQDGLRVDRLTVRNPFAARRK